MTFSIGDKVMQIENDYDKEVYNGDIGFVETIDLELSEMTIAFDGRPVAYAFGQLDQIVLAYATTIHKSQGSEYPAVEVLVELGSRWLASSLGVRPASCGGDNYQYFRYIRHDC